MHKIQYNILNRAKSNAKQVDQIYNFLRSKSISIQDFKANPDRYANVIEEYSRACIHQSLYEETQERLDKEFNKLCEYHTQNEGQLTNEFYDTAKQIILSSTIDLE